MKSKFKSVYTAVRDFFKTADMLLLALCLVLSAIGMVLIYSATRSYETNSYFYVQLASIIIGLVLFIILSVIDIDIITQKWPILLAFNILIIAALFIWGVEGDTGNKSWFRFGPVGIQPSEVVKVTFIILFAKQMSFLHNSNRGISSPISMAQLVLHLLLMFGLIVVTSADLGSALVFIAIFAVMCFAGGVKLIWFLLGIGAVAALAPLAWNNFFSEYQKARIMAPYFPETVDPDGLGITWQVNHSKIALASGGFWGQGYMNGAQSQSDALFAKHTDFIFSVAGEEFGAIGCIVIIALLLAVIIRCIHIGLKSNNYMNTVICCGVAAMLGFQTFENIGMCLGLTPVIGLTIPFLSYGGSSIVSCFAAIGIVSGIRIRPNPIRRYR
ncbi:MAG: FtsW/RodA/SpoVE family cell cycle protein [Clostridiales bacterium]|nr:FtsW/RodA/SpoVE family cell cycle protein [Clostridiales bacterium]